MEIKGQFLILLKEKSVYKNLLTPNTFPYMRPGVSLWAVFLSFFRIRKDVFTKEHSFLHIAYAIIRKNWRIKPNNPHRKKEGRNNMKQKLWPVCLVIVLLAGILGGCGSKGPQVTEYGEKPPIENLSWGMSIEDSLKSFGLTEDDVTISGR